MEQKLQLYIEHTLGNEYFNKHHIIHLHMADEGWKPINQAKSSSRECYYNHAKKPLLMIWRCTPLAWVERYDAKGLKSHIIEV